MQVVSVQTEENANQAIVAQVAIGYYNEPQPVIPPHPMLCDDAKHHAHIGRGVGGAAKNLTVLSLKLLWLNRCCYLSIYYSLVGIDTYLAIL